MNGGRKETLPDSWPEDWPRMAIQLIEGLEEDLAAERAKVAALEELLTDLNDTCEYEETLGAALDTKEE